MDRCQVCKCKVKKNTLLPYHVNGQLLFLCRHCKDDVIRLLQDKTLDWTKITEVDLIIREIRRRINKKSSSVTITQELADKLQCLFGYRRQLVCGIFKLLPREDFTLTAGRKVTQKQFNEINFILSDRALKQKYG